MSLLVLHVGMPRTATTSLQRSLAELRPQLQRQGVGYLGQTDLTGLSASAGWANRIGAEDSLRGEFTPSSNSWRQPNLPRLSSERASAQDAVHLQRSAGRRAGTGRPRRTDLPPLRRGRHHADRRCDRSRRGAAPAHRAPSGPAHGVQPRLGGPEGKGLCCRSTATWTTAISTSITRCKTAATHRTR